MIVILDKELRKEIDDIVKLWEDKNMIADFSGNFTNADNCHEGDKGKVLTEGTFEEKENFKGDIYTALNLDIEVNGKKLIHSPRMAEGKNLVRIWGKETKNWINKEFICHVINYKSMGQTKQCIELEPL